MNLKQFFAALIILLISINLVYAQEEDFTEAKNIIASKVACDKLSNEQLELIGDYYMEQMHPGESHEMMDKMMGGEGSENLRQMHISMARTLHCGESGGMMGNGGMMNMMGGNMMGGGMMTPLWTNIYGNNGYFLSPFYSILSLVLFGLIIYFGFKAFHEHGRDNKWLWMLVGSVILFVLFGTSGMGGFGMMGVGLGFGMLMMLLFWGAVIWLIVAFVKSLAGKDGSEEPLAILKKRYVKGELTKKEYESMKKEISN
ncbi:SHOCT domain-containing protein [Candidatus Woesearchaeota archaeon]|nr:SHOCT domain-containing protein [Candidatus Woesearchaeota archaeon]